MDWSERWLLTLVTNIMTSPGCTSTLSTRWRARNSGGKGCSVPRRPVARECQDEGDEGDQVGPQGRHVLDRTRPQQFEERPQALPVLRVRPLASRVLAGRLASGVAQT